MRELNRFEMEERGGMIQATPDRHHICTICNRKDWYMQDRSTWSYTQHYVYHLLHHLKVLGHTLRMRTKYITSYTRPPVWRHLRVNRSSERGLCLLIA